MISKNSLKIKTKFLFFICLIIIIIISDFTIIYINENKTRSMEGLVYHADNVINKSEYFLGDLRDAETGQRGFLLTQDDKYLEPYYSGKVESQKELKKLKLLVSNNPVQIKRLNKIDKLVKDKFAEMEATIKLVRDNNYDLAIELVKNDSGKELMDSIRTHINEFVIDKESTLENRKQIHKKYENNINIYFIFSAISLFIIIIIFYLIVKESFLKRIDKLIEWASLSDHDDRLKKYIENSFKDSNDEIGILANRLFYESNELKKNLAFYQSFQKATSEGNMVSRSNLEGIITYVNDEFCKATGYTKEEVLGKPHNIIRHPDTPKSTFKNLWKTIQSNKVWSGIIKNKKKDGSAYWVDSSISPLVNEEGEIVEYIAIRHDITELINQREEIQRSAQTDTLTGYGNRSKLLEDIKTAQNPSLIIINIDNFREINDFYGNSFGDKVIISLSKLISNNFNFDSNIELYRIQGDEFAILNRRTNKDNCVKVINELIQDISKTNLFINDEEISIQITASLSFENIEELFVTADMTMKIAKKENKNLLVYHENLGLNKEYQNNLKWTGKLKSAIKDDRLVPFYQPIVNNSNGKWEKYESLVRIIDDDGQIISPFFFLDIAKRTKNYINLTKIVIQKSFETFKDGDVEFSINLTIQDIMDTGLNEFIFEKLREFNNGHRVVFEIVESEGIENFDTILEFIKGVKEYGCKIAIDDFGTGYSNFEYLLQLKADYIKIDGSMIKDIDKDEDARIVVSTVVDFAKKMKIKTIAEFVENEAIETIVKDMGVDYCQGYHFSAPKPEPRSINI